MTDVERIINDGDPKRVWHEHTCGCYGGETNGICVWVGSYDLRDQILNPQFAHLGMVLPGAVHSALFNPSRYFSTPEVATYQANKRTGEITHFGFDCGSRWLGMAQFPLPTDAHLPTSEWARWTHLIHWDWSIKGHKGIRYPICETLPVPVEVMDYIASTQPGYPTDLRVLTAEVIRDFGLVIEGVPEKVLYFHLPWFSPYMGRPVSELSYT